MCGLCATVCPRGLDPAALFLSLRRKAPRPPARLSGLLRHESVSASALLRLHLIPPGCRTVFFPGCGLAGTRPATTRRTFEALSSLVPKLGLVLDCCLRPSHDTGCSERFSRRFGALTERLHRAGVKRILAACPGCLSILAQNRKGIAVGTVYEVLAESPVTRLPDGLPGPFRVHDPCSARRESGLHEAVRRIVRKSGAGIVELPRSREKTLCCGKGCGVNDPAAAALIAREAGGLPIVTYCAGCAEALCARHVLDLLFPPAGTAPVFPYPAAYAQRYLLKRRMIRRSRS